MKSMSTPEGRDAVLARIRRLGPESARRWGRMTAHEMVCHLTDQLRIALGDLPTKPARGPLTHAPLKQFVIYLMPWPEGKLKSPAESKTTRPSQSWEADVRRLCELVERFASRPARGEWPQHPTFGAMSGRAWGVFSHRHFDHHLRQFGV